MREKDRSVHNKKSCFIEKIGYKLDELDKSNSMYHMYGTNRRCKRKLSANFKGAAILRKGVGELTIRHRLAYRGAPVETREFTIVAGRRSRWDLIPKSDKFFGRPSYTLRYGYDFFSFNHVPTRKI